MRGIGELLELYDESMMKQCYEKVLEYEQRALEWYDFDFQS